MYLYVLQFIWTKYLWAQFCSMYLFRFKSTNFWVKFVSITINNDHRIFTWISITSLIQLFMSEIRLNWRIFEWNLTEWSKQFWIEIRFNNSIIWEKFDSNQWSRHSWIKFIPMINVFEKEIELKIRAHLIETRFNDQNIFERIRFNDQNIFE